VKTRRRPSLGRRLLVGLALVSAAYWGVVALLTVRDSVNGLYALFDAHLAQTALALLRVTDPDDGDPAAVPDTGGDAPTLASVLNPWPHLTQRLGAHGGNGSPVVAGTTQALQQDYERHLRYQVFSGNGALLLRSANAPEAAITGIDGYSETEDADGRAWRHFAVWDRHHDFRIVVSEDHDLRYRLVRSMALHTAGPLALGLPVLLLLLWLPISQGLNPLESLTREIESRKPDNLAPLDASVAPQEVRPMVTALNRLLHRVTHTLEGERRFTANAAHELRTPLAAIQAHLHLARKAGDGAERGQAMDQLQQGVERGIRLVGQLLTMARLDPEQALPDAGLVKLGTVAEAVCAQLAPLALARDQTLELHADAGLPAVAGNADLLSMLLSNLVDNAIRYTPAGGRIDVRVKPGERGVRFEVADDGPGIPPAARNQVFERFVRLPGNEQPGTGLGLAICRRIAELHRTQITLAEGANGRGTVASLLLPTRAA
jgi:signal transduction histidine kinase